MKKNKVLEVKITKINDDYSVFYIVYQDEKILARGEFIDEELRVESCSQPDYEDSTLFVLGYNDDLDNKIVTISNDDVDSLMYKVNKINEKYAGNQFNIKREFYNDVYYKIDFSRDGYNDGIVPVVESFDMNDYYNFDNYNYFADEDEAIACYEHLKDELLKFRMNWNK